MKRIISRCAALLALVGACVAVSFSATAQTPELRIGFLAPKTGIFAQIGADMNNGFQMYLDEHNGMLGGAKVTLIVEDDQGKPDLDVTKAKKLILQDKVDMLVGALLASSAYALGPVSTAEKILYIGSSATADDLAQRQADKYPYVAFSTWTPSLPNHPLGQWACEQGHKKMVAIAADYAFGYEQMGGFQKAFEDCGGKIVQKIWVPLGTKDFGPYIPTMKSEADAIFTLMVGPMSLQFPKQLRGAGDKRPIIAGGTSYDEFVLPFMGDEVIGDVSALMYSGGTDDAEERSLREGLPRQVRQGAVVLLGRQLHHRALDRRGDDQAPGQVPRPGRVHQDHGQHQDRCAARAGAARSGDQEPGRERLYQEGREEDDVRLRQARTLEYGDQDLSERRHVLHLRQGQVPRAAGLQPRLPALQILRITRA